VGVWNWPAELRKGSDGVLLALIHAIHARFDTRKPANLNAKAQKNASTLFMPSRGRLIANAELELL
jgi:hypothetical protein